MNHRKDYVLFKRGASRGGSVWYYSTYDPYGRRTVARSTGQTNKTLAERYCNGLLRDGTLVPAKARLFSDFSKDWWVWDRWPVYQGKAEAQPRWEADNQQNARK